MPDRDHLGLKRRELLKAASAGLGALLLSSLDASGTGEPAPAGQSAFVGVVSDLLTGQPISGATVRAEPSGATTATDRAGAYRLDLPPGAYSLGASAPAYHDLTYAERVLPAGQAVVVNFDLVRLGLTQAEEKAVYARLGLQVEAPALDPRLLPAAQAQGLSLPQYIIVRSTSSVCGYTDTPVPLEDYVKGVVPNEVPYYWPAETLKAQAVAARSYGVVSFLARGYVYDDTRSQVYNPARRTAQTDAAVDATRSVVVTYGGGIAQGFFFAQCNALTTRDSEHALDWQKCQEAGWSYVAYCRARPCGGHSPYNNGCPGQYYGYRGHGVGMCQWGAYARGNVSSYRDILQWYYTGVGVQAVATSAALVPTYPSDGMLVAPGSVPLAWSGAGASYNVEVAGLASFTTSATTQRLQIGSPGTYRWRVQAVDADGTAGPWSEERTFQVANQIYRIYLPLVCKQ